MRVLTAPVAARRPVLDLATLPTASLAEVAENAALMRRVDRKYIVAVPTAQTFIDQLEATHAVLEIDGRRSTTYRSMYFDTPSLFAVRSHVQRRRRRWKVRQRLYVQDDLCRIEVKTKNGRGETVKVVGPSSVESYGRLVEADSSFVESVLSDHPAFRIEELVPCVEVAYERATLTDLEAGTRVTIDSGLAATLDGGTAWIDDQFVVIETKGGAVPAHADRVLRRLGAKQRSFSKSVATTSLIRDDVKDNDVRSLCGTSLHVRFHPSEGLS
jgi:hypothetical protein